MRSAWVGMSSVMFLVACGASRPPPPPPPASAVAAPVAAPAMAPLATLPAQPQLFAPAAPPQAFADPDRRAKLAAAFPAIDIALVLVLVALVLACVAGGIVIVGELAYAKGCGVVDPATKTVPDADTVYRIGSISKSFTGLALLSLRDEGVLSLEDPLARWIPEAAKIVYPTRDERPITLHQLAQHTSGLPRMGPFDPDHAPDEATVVGSLAKIELERAPGLESVYSNLGFSLLKIVVSHAAKQPLHDVVAARIWKPLGMSSTSWDAASTPTGHLAPAIDTGPDASPTPPTLLAAATGAGGIYSSVRDMAKYAAFLLAAYPPRDADDQGPIRRATISEAQLTGFALEPRIRPARDAKAGEPSIELDAPSYGFGWVHDQTCTATDLVWL